MKRTRARFFATAAAIALIGGLVAVVPASSAPVAVECTKDAGVLTCPYPDQTTTVTEPGTTQIQTVTSTTTAPGTTVTPPTVTTTATVTSTVTSTPTTTTTVPTTTTTTTPPPAGPWSAPVFTETFDTPAAAPMENNAAYAAKWYSYNCWLGGNPCDTKGKNAEVKSPTTGGYYRPEQMSVSGGRMDVNIKSIVDTDGVLKARVAAPMPQLTEAWPINGMLGGRYSADVNVTPGMSNFKAAWLLWPDTGSWNDGEIDYPEGSFTGTIVTFTHRVLAPNLTNNCSGPGPQNKRWDAPGMHNVVIEWVPSNGNTSDALNPGSVSTFYDGVLQHTTTNPACVPSKSMHWVMQMETGIGQAQPAAATEGHVYIDNVTIQRYVAP